MKKSSTTKDITLFSLLALIIVLLILSMYQRDRGWVKLSQLQRALDEQSRDVSSLRGTLNATQRKLDALNAETSQLTSSVNQSTEKLANAVLVAPKTNTENKDNTDNQTAQNLANKETKLKKVQKGGGVPIAFKRAQAATEQPDYAQGDWNVNALGSGLKTLTPLVSSEANASEIQSYVLESLITRDPDTLEWIGLIAKDWTVSDDGLIITFNLRNDVYFSDGEQLTSADVVFSFDFIMNEKIQAPRLRAYYEKIKQVEALDPFTVRFTFKEPYFRALALAGGFEILPKHFYESYLENPSEFNQSKGLLMGSGPYKLNDPKGWTPDNGNVELVRNPRYWGDVQPAFDRVIWRIIENASARLTTYRNGDIDRYTARPIEYKKLRQDKQINDKSHHFEYMSSVIGYSYIAWNQLKDNKPTLFADKRVRQAMTYLLDRDLINETIYLGYAETAISPFSKRSKQHNLALKPRAYDVEKGKALLKAAGFEDRDGNGVLENAAGDPFEFKLTYFQGNEDTSRMILLIKDLYAKAGIKLIPSPQEWPVMIDLLKNKNFDAITLGWTSGIETDIFQMFHSSQAQTNGDNFINYKSPALDKLIDEARSTVDDTKRMPLWQQAESIMYDDQPYTFLFRRKSLRFLDKRIKNLKMTKLGLNDGDLPLEQYVPKALQRYTH